MNFKHDERGNLQPYDLIEISAETFEDTFVTRFDSKSSRHRLYENYKNYMSELNKLLTRDYFQLIDGSFITTKENPKDIDFLTVVDYRDYEDNKAVIEKEFASFFGRSKYQVDGYIMSYYPETHKRHLLFQSDFLYWRDLFGKTRINRARKQFPKGIIQLKFQEDER